MLGRTPLFPGKNFVEQLGLIFDIIGTPNSNEISQIKSAKAQKFMQSMGPRPRKSFKSIFANASPEAIDLLENLLQFNPRKRFSVNEALRHPYMKSLEARYKFQDPEVSISALLQIVSNINVTTIVSRKHRFCF